MVSLNYVIIKEEVRYPLQYTVCFSKLRHIIKKYKKPVLVGLQDFVFNVKDECTFSPVF